MRQLVSLFSLLAMALVAQPSAAAGGPHSYQRKIPRTLAAFPTCGDLNDGDLVIVTDASSDADCDAIPEANPLNWVSALCVCDGGARRAVYTAPDLSAYVPVTKAGPQSITATGADNDITLSAADDVHLAPAGEVTLKGGSLSPSRTVRVDQGATANGTTVFNSVKAAADYVATQSPSTSARWKILVDGGVTYTEDPFTIPAWTDLTCTWGGFIYSGLETGGTVIKNTAGTALSGAFVAMGDGAALRGCIIRAQGDSTGVRAAVDCLGGCDLDHVGVSTDETGASTQANVGIRAVSGGGKVATLYYVVVTQTSTNTNAVSIQIGAGNAMQFSNGIVGSGGAMGIGVQALSDSPYYNWMHNVRVGSAYGGSGPTTAISVEGTGAFHVSDVEYETSSGTINNLNRTPQARAYAALPPCDATTLGMLAIDTSNSNELCGCSGAGPAWAPTDGAGTCD